MFYYHRNDALNATNFFNNAAGIDKEKVLIHQFGFNVGGPIVKDKLFFFVNYEEERSPGSASVVRRVLTNSARAGDFDYVRQDNGQVATLNLFDLTGLTADPAVNALIDLTPQPNDASVGDGRNISGFRFNSPDRSESDWLVFRGDYKINERHSFTGSFHQFRIDTPNSVFNGIDAVFPGLPGAGQNSVRRLGSFSLSSEFTPTIINEGRFGFQTGSGRFFNNETFPQGYRLAFSSEGDLFSNPIRGFLAQGRDTRNLDLMDNMTWVNGLHTIKVGGVHAGPKSICSMTLVFCRPTSLSSAPETRTHWFPVSSPAGSLPESSAPPPACWVFWGESSTRQSNGSTSPRQRLDMSMGPLKPTYSIRIFSPSIWETPGVSPPISR